MSLISLVVVLIVVGLLLYLVNNFIPMDPKIKQILNIVVVIFLILWLLVTFLPALGFHDIYLGGRK